MSILTSSMFIGKNARKYTPITYNFSKLKISYTFNLAVMRTSKCIAVMVADVSNNTDCIDYSLTIQITNAVGYSVIGLVFQVAVSVVVMIYHLSFVLLRDHQEPMVYRVNGN